MYPQQNHANPQHSPSQATTPGSHISRLDTLRQTSHITGFERWSILRVFHQLKHDDEERDASDEFHYGRWRECSSRLLRRSLSSVQKVTAGWNNQFQSGIPDDETVRTYVFDTSGMLPQDLCRTACGCSVLQLLQKVGTISTSFSTH